MKRVNRKLLEELEETLKKEERVEIVIIDTRTDEIIRTVETARAATVRVVIRL